MPMGITRVADQYGFLPEAERHRENLAAVHEEAMQIAAAHSGHRITPGLNDPRRMAAARQAAMPPDIDVVNADDWSSEMPPGYEFESTGHDVEPDPNEMASYYRGRGEYTRDGRPGPSENTDLGGYFNAEGEPLMSGPEMRSEQYHDDLSAQEYAQERHYGDDY